MGMHLVFEFIFDLQRKLLKAFPAIQMEQSHAQGQNIFQFWVYPQVGTFSVKWILCPA